MGQRWIMAALRKREFFSLAEVNQANRRIAGALERAAVPQAPGQSATLFAQPDRPALARR